MSGKLRPIGEARCGSCNVIVCEDRDATRRFVVVVDLFDLAHIGMVRMDWPTFERVYAAAAAIMRGDDVDDDEESPT